MHIKLNLGQYNKVYYFFFFFLFFLNLPALASQDAIVSAPMAPVRQEPDERAEILEYRKNGEPIRVSSKDYLGFYKIRTYGGKYGWVWHKDIYFLHHEKVVQPRTEDLVKATERRMFWYDPADIISLGGVFFPFASPDMNTKLGLKSYKPALSPGAYFDIGFLVGPQSRIALRAFYYGTSFTVEHWGDVYEVTHYGIPLMIGYQYFWPGAYWHTGLNFFAGLSPYDKVTVFDASKTGINSFEATESLAVAGQISFFLIRKLSYYFNLAFELGVFYSHGWGTDIGADFAGSDPFKSGAKLDPIRITRVGPLFTMALQYKIY